MMINSGVSEEEVLSSFEDLDLKTNENTLDAPKPSQRGVEDLLGQPSGKFDYKVFYSKPPSYDIPIESITPRGWGEEYGDDNELISENSEKPEAPKQPHQRMEDLLGQPSGKFDYKVFYTKPSSSDIPFETIVPTGWGDEFEEEDKEGYNVRIDNAKVNHDRQE